MATINFKGKEIVRNHHLTIPYHELVPDGKKSLTKKVSLNDNLIIHGDNLLALKALLPTYAGKVKCIYIDPPYNTGNEKWIYNDNVNSPMMKDWLGKAVDLDDLTRHDKWLCMMVPRLKILRELLSDDGSIFISIDDNEIHDLCMIMDDIFGEDNLVNQIVVKSNPRGRQTDEFLATQHDYIVFYAKDITQFEIVKGKALDATTVQSYKNADESGLYRRIELRKRGYASRQIDRPNLHYPIFFNSKTKDLSLEQKKGYEKIVPQLSSGENGVWRWSKGKFEKNKNLLEVTKGRGGYRIHVRDYLNIDGIQKTTKFKSIWDDKEFNYENGTEELKEIFGENLFSNPKPTILVKNTLIMATGKEDVILDSFAGSGTTAHAVLSLNKADGGSRKFILVETEDYANKITAERVRRIIKGIKSAKDENLQKGLGGSFSYFELGKPIDTERILKGKDLPTFAEMARYIFYTATGEEFNEKKVNEKTGLIGESKEYQVYLLYKPDMEYLKSTALTLERAEALGKFMGKKRLVFAPAKYLDQEHLERHHIDFAQLPFEIYQKQ